MINTRNAEAVRNGPTRRWVVAAAGIAVGRMMAGAALGAVSPRRNMKEDQTSAADKARGVWTVSAGNAAQTLANEQTLGVQAPSVLGNQAQFLLGATLSLCSQGEKLGSSDQGVAKTVELTNARRRRVDRLAGEDILRLRFQFSHLLRESAAAEIGQEEAAR